ncbi:MAG TPA: hypothetical protein DDW17_09790 [Deltaproteobacteria bacterium]|nr:hypothetical protein [Deltaproteobacteria bacterium]
MKKIIVVFVMILVAGCGPIQINMDSLINPISCNVEVKDNRPYKYIASAAYGPIEIIPEDSIEKILKAKLCNNKTFYEWYNKDKSIYINIDELDFRIGNFITYIDFILYMNGSINIDTYNQQIKAVAVVQSNGFIRSFIPTLIDKCIDDFVSKVEKTIIQQG